MDAVNYFLLNVLTTDIVLSSRFIVREMRDKVYSTKASVNKKALHSKSMSFNMDSQRTAFVYMKITISLYL